MGILETIALSMGIAWASGINLYAAVGTLGILGATGHMVLPHELQILQDPVVIAAAGLMYCVEFFADKVPASTTPGTRSTALSASPRAPSWPPWRWAM